MGDEALPHDVAKGVLELHVLDKEIVLGVDAGGRVGVLEVEAEPLLDAEALQAWRSRCQVHEEDEVEREGRGKDGVAAEEVHLDLHRVAEPTKDVNVIPTLFVITTWRVIVDADLVVNVLVEVGVKFGLEDVLEYAQLGDLFGLEGLGIIEDFAVAVAEDVGGVPATDAEITDLEGRCQDGLDEGLAGLEVLAADRSVHLPGKLLQCGDINGEVGCTVGKRDAFLEGGPGVHHRGRDARVVFDEALLEGFEGLVDGGLLEIDLGGTAPDHDLAVGLRFELGDVVADLVGEVALVLADFYLLAFETLDVVLIEDSRYGLDGLEEGADLFELVAVEDLGGLGCVVEVAAEDVPSGEDEVVEVGDGDEVLNERRASVGALAETDGAHLRGRADGFGEATADRFYARDEGCCYGSHAGDHDAKFSCCRLDAGRFLRGGSGCRHSAQYPSVNQFSVNADSSVLLTAKGRRKYKPVVNLR